VASKFVIVAVVQERREAVRSVIVQALKLALVEIVLPLETFIITVPVNFEAFTLAICVSVIPPAGTYK
jgi:hypothetical protein